MPPPLPKGEAFVGFIITQIGRENNISAEICLFCTVGDTAPYNARYKLPYGKLGNSWRFLSVNNSASCAHLRFHTKLGIEDLFTQADRFGCYLDKLVIIDVLDRFLKREDLRRN